jgi:fructose-specific component phosphotransferase system IIB-like protein
MKRTALIISVLSLIIISTNAFAAKFVVLKAVDKDYLMVYFKDGDVCFVDDGLGTDAFTGNHQTANNYRVNYGTALNTTNAVATANWTIKAAADNNYGTTGLHPSNCYRKSRMNGMGEMDWGSGDWIYQYTMEHWIFLQLPASLSQGTTYTLEINSNTYSDVTSQTITFDIFNSPSEAVHTNLVGYLNDDSVKAADLFIYMGSGGARDYSSFVGKKVYIYNVDTSVAQEVNTVSFWKASATEMIHWNLTGSNVWKADFTGFNTPGTYRVAIEGVGCSENFEIKADAYFEPFRVSTIGYFYMRVGQETNAPGMPVPRRPLYIPGVSPASTKVYITTVQPWDANWNSIPNDKWDNPGSWAAYKKPGSPQNNNAYGGHSDAADWDRHLGHISNIYDMLLPYILTDGKLNDDNLQIVESGNGIPDILDEARNEVDFWLRLRDGAGYSFGVTNPDGSNNLYQAGTTPIAAWANAANTSMLANCFMLAGLDSLKDTYYTAAVTAYNYASALPDQMLDASQDVGNGSIRGRDLKMMAAAFLYNLDGNTVYENMVNTLSNATTNTSSILTSSMNQLYGSAGYLKTQQTVHYPDLVNRMKASIIYEANNIEAKYSNLRPTRRASDEQQGWFKTSQNVQRSIVAHAIADSPSDKQYFENALVLEADWGLGRNNMNTIIMTTACTNLANKRSIRNAYTTGRDDGSFGVHPGYTPYLNTEDWSSSGMVGNRPSVLAAMCYPAYSGWPAAEGYFDTRYVWAHTECTPQQTMRGKMALYGYLYGLTKVDALTADFDGLAVFCDSWLKVPADPGYDLRANLYDDPSGIVDLLDFALFANDW